jgi:sugar phosphate isomerase/epimerase
MKKIKIRLCAFADEADASLNGQISALQANGISLIELRGIDGKNIADCTLPEAENIGRALEAGGISVWSIGSPLGKSKIEDDFAAERKKLEHVLALCKIFRCDKIRMFSFFTTEFARYREEIMRRLKEMRDIARAEGITLYHENEREIYGDTAARVRDILDGVSGLGCIYDPANFVQCGQNTDEAMRLLFDRAGYFHIKDALAATGEVVPAGFGDGGVDRLIGRLQRDYTLTVEPHLAVFAGYSDIDKSPLKNKFAYKSPGEAFGAAVFSLKELLKKSGFVYNEGVWEKEADV